MLGSPFFSTKLGGFMDSHLIAAIRLILAVSALVIVDYASIPNFRSEESRVALMIYIGYCAVLYLGAIRSARYRQSISKWAHWSDLGWFTLLLSLSGGMNSVFFFGYLFVILVASFGWGFRPGLIATILSACLFITGGILIQPSGDNAAWPFDMTRFLVRILYLVVLGYLMAHWGGLKSRLNRQMMFLQEIATASPPRLGIRNLVSSAVNKLREFYDADTCLLLLDEPSTSEHSLYRTKRDQLAGTTETETMPAEIGEVLLAPAPEHAIVFSEGLRGWRSLDYVHSFGQDEQAAKKGEGNKVLATFLDARSFISVPLRHHNRAAGRLYLTARRRNAFDTSDLGFLMQIGDQLMPVIDSIRLVDRLAAEAAEEERKRIARDIHDSIIQPYIGLQMGLAGVRQKLTLEDGEQSGEIRRSLERLRQAAADTDRLIEMTADGISDLRRYVNGLKPTGEASLLASVKRFAEKFSQATNIAVQIRSNSAIQVDDRLATEIFQMIVEGLSNIRRHTESGRAFIGLESSDSRLILRIENDGTRGVVPEPFSPQSIAERATALRGHSSVEIFGDMGTSVIIDIPINSLE